MLNGTATLHGTVNPNGADTTAWFQWRSAYDHGSSNTPLQSVGSDTNDLAVDVGLTGLTPGMTYHYRCGGSNSLGVVRGTNQVFWLPALTLNSPNPLTNECHVPFVDPTTANASPLAIAAGLSHSLALKADGSVICWGANNSGQTTIPADATNVVAIAAGRAHSLALKADGSVIGWGYNKFGQRSISANATNVVAIAAGVNHSLALRADGAIVGWGLNSFRQIAIPESVHQLNLPISVNGSVDANALGTYPLSYSVTNALGAVATTNRTVIVADTLPPVLTVLGENPLMHELGAPFVDPGATVIDLCAGDRTGNIYVWGSVNTNATGSYPLAYIVTDPSGNLAVTNRTVVVVTRPVLTGSERTESGAFSFTLTNTPGARFSVLASTNLFLPSDQWNVLDSVIENPPGVFQFTDDTATNDPARFYQLRWP